MVANEQRRARSLLRREGGGADESRWFNDHGTLRADQPTRHAHSLGGAFLKRAAGAPSTGDALGSLTAFLDRYYDIMRDAESNVVVLEGHDITPETREMFRADLPEFNLELVEAEIRRQYQPRTGATEGVAA